MSINVLPSICDSMFTFNKATHSYITRHFTQQGMPMVARVPNLRSILKVDSALLLNYYRTRVKMLTILNYQTMHNKTIYTIYWCQHIKSYCIARVIITFVPPYLQTVVFLLRLQYGIELISKSAQVRVIYTSTASSQNTRNQSCSLSFSHRMKVCPKRTMSGMSSDTINITSCQQQNITRRRNTSKPLKAVELIPLIWLLKTTFNVRLCVCVCVCVCVRVRVRVRVCVCALCNFTCCREYTELLDRLIHGYWVLT